MIFVENQRMQKNAKTTYFKRASKSVFYTQKTEYSSAIIELSECKAQVRALNQKTQKKS